MSDEGVLELTIRRVRYRFGPEWIETHWPIARFKNRRERRSAFHAVELVQGWYKGVEDHAVVLVGEEPGGRGAVDLPVGVGSSARATERALADRIGAHLGIPVRERRWDEPRTTPDALPTPYDPTRPVTECDLCDVPAYDTGRTEQSAGRTWRIAWCPSCREEITFWEAPPLVSYELAIEGEIVGEALDHECERYVVVFHDDRGRPYVRSLDLRTGTTADATVPAVPRAFLAAVGGGVAAVLLGLPEMSLDDEGSEVEGFAPRMLWVCDTGTGQALWSVSVDAEPFVTVAGGVVGLDWQPSFLRRGVPGRDDEHLDARTGAPVPGLDRATFRPLREAAAARRDVQLSEMGRVGEGDPAFASWADRVETVLGFRPVHTLKATRFGPYDVVDCFGPQADGFAEHVLVLRGSDLRVHERPRTRRATSYLVATGWTMTDPWRAGRWLVIAGTTASRRFVLVDDADAGAPAA